MAFVLQFSARQKTIERKSEKRAGTTVPLEPPAPGIQVTPSRDIAHVVNRQYDWGLGGKRREKAGQVEPVRDPMQMIDVGRNLQSIQPCLDGRSQRGKKVQRFTEQKVLSPPFDPLSESLQRLPNEFDATAVSGE